MSVVIKEHVLYCRDELFSTKNPCKRFPENRDSCNTNPQRSRKRPVRVPQGSHNGQRLSGSMVCRVSGVVIATPVSPTLRKIVRIQLFLIISDAPPFAPQDRIASTRSGFSDSDAEPPFRPHRAGTKIRTRIESFFGGVVSVFPWARFMDFRGSETKRSLP